jgi:hypothetical protein
MIGCNTAAGRWWLLACPVYPQDAVAASQVVQQRRWAAATTLQLMLQLLCRDGAEIKRTLELQLQQQPLQELQLQICWGAVVAFAAAAAATAVDHMRAVLCCYGC